MAEARSTRKHIRLAPLWSKVLNFDFPFSTFDHKGAKREVKLLNKGNVVLEFEISPLSIKPPR